MIVVLVQHTEEVEKNLLKVVQHMGKVEKNLGPAFSCETSNGCGTIKSIFSEAGGCDVVDARVLV